MAGQVNCSPLHICVVGAGIAGLRCASSLIKQGVTVTILEARDRIGGRICQSNELGYPIDMGPNWIYTSSGEDQVIMRLARQTETPLHLWNEDVRLFDSDGKTLEKSRALRLQETIWNLFESSFSYSIKHSSEIPTSASLYMYVRERIASLDVPDEDRELLANLSQMWGNYTGDPIQRQSLKYVWTEVVCGGGDEYFVASNFANILKHAAQIPLAEADIQLGTKVIGLTSSVDRVTGQTVVQVCTQSGKPQLFDGVVVTIPLGWLKVNKHVFEPSLPDQLKESIDAISVGHLEKVYINFPRAFWRTEKGNPDHHPLDHTIWLSPRYAQDTNPFRWPLESYDLAAFDQENSHPTLLHYLFGDESAYICSIVHQHPDKEEQYALLDVYFRPYYSRLPNYDPEDSGCKPKAYLVSQWRYDELAGYGSYCNMQVGIDGADLHILRLQEGLPERGIWFAGEHAAPIEERGTVGGAWLSGELAADKVMTKHSQK